MDVKEKYQPTAQMEKSRKKMIKLKRICRLQKKRVQYVLNYINLLAMKSHPATTAFDHSNFYVA